MQLPDVLEACRGELDAALSTAIPGNWPEDESYLGADQPGAIAGVVIEPLHPQLALAKIGYLFREKMERRGQVRLGTAAKASSKVLFLTGLDFLIEFNWQAWRELTPKQRIALVDHELCHCERDIEKGVYTLRHHDVEEFSEIVRRWGLWTPDLCGFGRVAIGAVQEELFEGARAT